VQRRAARWREVVHEHPGWCCSVPRRHKCNLWREAQELKSETARWPSGLRGFAGRGARGSLLASARDCRRSCGETRLEPTALLMANGRPELPVGRWKYAQTGFPHAPKVKCYPGHRAERGGSRRECRPWGAVLYAAYLGISSRSRVTLHSLGSRSSWRKVWPSSATLDCSESYT
jgi:hypothetical protein